MSIYTLIDGTSRAIGQGFGNGNQALFTLHGLILPQDPDSYGAPTGGLKSCDPPLHRVRKTSYGCGSLSAAPVLELSFRYQGHW